MGDIKYILCTSSYPEYSPVKKILILTANPKDTDNLRLNEEVREIQTGLERARRRDQFEIISRWAVRPDDLRRALSVDRKVLRSLCDE